MSYYHHQPVPSNGFTLQRSPSQNQLGFSSPQTQYQQPLYQQPQQQSPTQYYPQQSQYSPQQYQYAQQQQQPYGQHQFQPQPQYGHAHTHSVPTIQPQASYSPQQYPSRVNPSPSPTRSRPLPTPTSGPLPPPVSKHQSIDFSRFSQMQVSPHPQGSSGFHPTHESQPQPPFRTNAQQRQFLLQQPDPPNPVKMAQSRSPSPPKARSRATSPEKTKSRPATPPKSDAFQRGRQPQPPGPTRQHTQPVSDRTNPGLNAWRESSAIGERGRQPQPPTPTKRHTEPIERGDGSTFSQRDPSAFGVRGRQPQPPTPIKQQTEPTPRGNGDSSPMQRRRVSPPRFEGSVSPVREPPPRHPASPSRRSQPLPFSSPKTLPGLPLSSSPPKVQQVSSSPPKLPPRSPPKKITELPPIDGASGRKFVPLWKRNSVFGPPQPSSGQAQASAQSAFAAVSSHMNNGRPLPSAPGMRAVASAPQPAPPSSSSSAYSDDEDEDAMSIMTSTTASGTSTRSRSTLPPGSRYANDDDASSTSSLPQSPRYGIRDLPKRDADESPVFGIRDLPKRGPPALDDRSRTEGAGIRDLPKRNPALVNHTRSEPPQQRDGGSMTLKFAAMSIENGSKDWPDSLPRLPRTPGSASPQRRAFDLDLEDSPPRPQSRTELQRRAYGGMAEERTPTRNRPLSEYLPSPPTHGRPLPPSSPQRGRSALHQVPPSPQMPRSQYTPSSPQIQQRSQPHRPQPEYEPSSPSQVQRRQLPQYDPPGSSQQPDHRQPSSPSQAHRRPLPQHDSSTSSPRMPPRRPFAQSEYSPSAPSSPQASSSSQLPTRRAPYAQTEPPSSPQIRRRPTVSRSEAPQVTIESPAPMGGRDTIPRISLPDDDDQGQGQGPKITVYDVPGISVSVDSAPTISVSADDDPSPPAVVKKKALVPKKLHRAPGLICAGCGGAIVGRIVAAMGVKWHPGCFKCSVCDELLEHVSSYEHDGLPYCHLDFYENFAPQCYHCKTSIIEERFISLDDPLLGKRTYHEQHFFCSECGDPFLDPSSNSSSILPYNHSDSSIHESLEITGDGEFSGFVVYKGYPYCEACHVRLRLPKCKRCKKSIRDWDEAVEALGSKWCWGCFVCKGCERPFEDPSFFERQGEPYCENCFSVILRNEV